MLKIRAASFTTFLLLTSASTAADVPLMDTSLSFVPPWLMQNFFPQTAPQFGNLIIDWLGLCSSGQRLDDNFGCTPDCSQGSSNALCTNIFNKAQTVQLTGIPRPYLSDSIVVFALKQTGISSSAVFNVKLHQTPRNYGYMCEILNADATPAALWDTTTKAFTSIITMDYHISASPFISDNFINTVAQGTNGGGYWYINPDNQLYMLCIGYIANSGTNQLEASSACGGPSGTCVTYLLQ